VSALFSATGITKAQSHFRVLEYVCKDIPLAAWLAVSEIVDSEDSWVTQSYISISKMPE
jgi:hypothetical protein